MGLASNRLAGSVDEIGDAARAGDEELLVINPGEHAIGALVDRLRGTEGTTVRLLAAREPLKARLAEFRVAATVADLVADGRLAVRTLESAPRNALLVTPSSVTALVPGEDRVAGLTETDEPFAAEAFALYDDRWERAPEFPLRTPPLSTVRETLREAVGEEVGADFDAMLDAVGDGTVDEVAIALLAAARNRALLYDISRWGEDVGLASKATFSRAKTGLEEAGLLDTEKVPIDVGRPRLRLTLPEGVAGESAAGLVAAAADRL
jgi:hypothetical protein